MESGQWKKIRIWQDNWLPRRHPSHALSCPLADFESATVDILIDPRSRQWNGDIVDGLFNTEEAKIIKSIPLSQTLLWRACHEAMPTKSALFRSKITPDLLCVRCQASAKTPLHALWSCTELDSVWSDTIPWRNRGSMQFVDFKEILLQQIKKKKNQLKLFTVTTWTIWNQRNWVRLNQPENALHQLDHLSKF